MHHKIAAFDADLTLFPHIHNIMCTKLKGYHNDIGTAVNFLKEAADGGLLFKEKTVALLNDIANAGVPIAIVTFNQFPEVLLKLLSLAGVSQGVVDNIIVITKTPTNENLAHGKNQHFELLIDLLNHKHRYLVGEFLHSKNSGRNLIITHQGKAKTTTYLPQTFPLASNFSISDICFVDDDRENCKMAKAIGVSTKRAKSGNSAHLDFMREKIFAAEKSQGISIPKNLFSIAPITPSSSFESSSSLENHMAHAQFHKVSGELSKSCSDLTKSLIQSQNEGFAANDRGSMIKSC